MKLTDIHNAYCLNLERRGDRLNGFYERWHNLRLPLEMTRVAAWDGEKIDPPKSWDVGAAAFATWLGHVHCLLKGVHDGGNFLVFEDDCVFREGFADRFAEALLDLPRDFDQLYLGYQLLDSGNARPTRITKRLGRVGDANRTHAVLYSESGARRILARICDLSQRKRGQHVDHWLGALHREIDYSGQHAFNCYMTIPALCFQAAGRSDINGAMNPQREWFYRGSYETEYKSVVEVVKWETEFGRIGRRGWLGYEKRRADIGDDVGRTVVSLHAPSALSVEVGDSVEVVGVMNSSGKAAEPVEVVVDGKVVGVVQNPGDKTEPVTLTGGGTGLSFGLIKR